MANIYIVDDSKVSRSIIREILEDGGHHIIGEAVNGEEMITQYDTLKPDVVTVDYEMPVMNGFVASEKILAKNTGAKIIMITSVMRKQEHLKALNAGVTAVLNKPVQESELLDAVNRALGKKA